MKILFITAFPPNRKTAGQNYSRNLLVDLSSEYEVDVLYWDYPNHDVEKHPKIHSYNRIFIRKFNKVVNIFIPLFPLFTRRFSLKVLRHLRQVSHNYDLLYFDFSQTFIYSRYIPHPLKVGMTHDVILQKYSRKIYGFLIYPWLKFSERFCMSKLNQIYSFSYKDQNLLASEYGLNSCVVPFYLDSNILTINLQQIKIEDYFVMYGAWNRSENQESLKWTIDRYPENCSKLLIIGGALPHELQNIVSKRRNIEYIGFVDNPYPIIAKSKGLIAPLFQGAGVKVKAIESLALGTPVIGTEVTFEGLPNINKQMMIKIHNKKDLCVAISMFEHISNKDKVEYQLNFKQNYIHKSFKEQCLSRLLTL